MNNATTKEDEVLARRSEAAGECGWQARRTQRALGRVVVADHVGRHDAPADALAGDARARRDESERRVALALALCAQSQRD